MPDCEHEYKFLEHAYQIEEGKRYWLFYCEKCLDIREVAKTQGFRYSSDPKTK